jgi:hypothetical protein
MYCAPNVVLEPSHWRGLNDAVLARSSERFRMPARAFPLNPSR